MKDFLGRPALFVARQRIPRQLVRAFFSLHSPLFFFCILSSRAEGGASTAFCRTSLEEPYPGGRASCEACS